MVSIIERLGEHHVAQGEKVIERLDGHYEAQEVPFGRVYKWSPWRLVLECDCGEEVTVSSSMATCRRCGAEHTTDVTPEELPSELLGDEALHPWRYVGDREDAGLPY